MKKKKDTNRTQPDKKKEQQIQSLIEILATQNIQVRRERLKRGSQWSVQSGICQLGEALTVFVDRNLSQDDQVEFLISTICQMSLSIDQTLLQALPKQVQNLLSAPKEAEAA
ncbi:MAG: hypothetical protein ACO3XO_09175 [Bdellovibrionota bacterium]